MREGLNVMTGDRNQTNRQMANDSMNIHRGKIEKGVSSDKTGGFQPVKPASVSRPQNVKVPPPPPRSNRG